MNIYQFLQRISYFSFPFFASYEDTFLFFTERWTRSHETQEEERGGGKKRLELVMQTCHHRRRRHVCGVLPSRPEG